MKQERLTRENYTSLLPQFVGPGDVIVDLSWNVETYDMLAWCGEHDVRYLNTPLEEWDPYGDIENKSPYERSLYSRQMRIRRLKSEQKSRSKPSATAIIDHGANPGLVSLSTAISGSSARSEPTRAVRIRSGSAPAPRPSLTARS